MASTTGLRSVGMRDGIIWVVMISLFRLRGRSMRIQCLDGAVLRRTRGRREFMLGARTRCMWSSSLLTVSGTFKYERFHDGREGGGGFWCLVPKLLSGWEIICGVLI
ncbi:uncharacterized protein BDW47DRAFT_105467, partial [Aspergillus candidus]